MASDYKIVATSRGEELVGGSRVATVLTVSFTTIPHDIYAEARINLVQVDATQVAPIVEAIAQSIEIIAGRADVAGLVYVQNVTAAGQIQDEMEITVQGSDPDFTDAFTWPLGELNEFVVGPVIQAHVDALNALAAL